MPTGPGTTRAGALLYAAGAVRQLPGDLPVAGEAAEDGLPAALLVPDELHAAPGTLLQQAELLKFQIQSF